ncbi:MAG: TIR domain-containing protein, partial [Proteobacteria bacterium]|nr:TIR domain-containing protein [Pseudomonadota bacterium]
MRRLQKLDLISTIGRELQATMTFSDVENFFLACGVDPNKPWSGTNSKWVYTKEILVDETDKKIIEIADELGIEHGYSISKAATSAADATFWTPGYFRLFISHTSSHKDRASMLQNVLRSYGITGFVAHEDIEPTKEWQEEIEKGLFSMDALA